MAQINKQIKNKEYEYQMTSKLQANLETFQSLKKDMQSLSASASLVSIPQDAALIWKELGGLLSQSTSLKSVPISNDVMKVTAVDPEVLTYCMLWINHDQKEIKVSYGQNKNKVVKLRYGVQNELYKEIKAKLK